MRRCGLCQQALGALVIEGDLQHGVAAHLRHAQDHAPAEGLVEHGIAHSVIRQGGGGRADVIIGPIGIVLANALLGEVTPAMARAVGESSAARILIPSGRCETLVAGVGDMSMNALLDDAMAKLGALLEDQA